MSRDSAALRDIAAAAREVIAFAGEFDRDAFLTDLRTQGAVLHRLIVLGEATKRLSATFRARHPDVPWRQAAGLRDVLVHDYDDVNLERVWTTATEDIPRLLDLIEPLLPPEEPTA